MISQEITIEEGFNVVKLENNTEKVLKYLKEVDNTFLQIHFCATYKTQLHFNERYTFDIPKNKSALLYNPNENLPINLSLHSRSKHLILIISIKVFHSFFSQVADIISFLDEDNKNKKFYLNKELKPSEIILLHQIFKEQIHNSLQKLYLKGKVYEMLSLYFNKTNKNEQACPFLEDEDNVEKIKKAKHIVINNMADPPTLQEIADEIVLSVPKLKEGFKHIYGETVFNFLLDYKLEYARKLLISKKYNISEISNEIGYSTASHFISAFKKKFGTTPKQYMMSL